SVPRTSISANGSDALDLATPAAARNAAGEAVVVWVEERPDGSGTDVFGRRLDSRGLPRGGPIRVNTSTLGNQSRPRVAMDAAGNSVRPWDAHGPSDASTIYARLFTPEGIPRARSGGANADPFQVNVSTQASPSHPSAAMDAAGDFVVAWEVDDTSG